MASFYPTDDLPALKTKIDSRAHDLFKEKPGKAPLRVTTIFKLKSKNNDGREICDSIRGLDIYDVEAMESLRDVRLPSPFLLVFCDSTYHVERVDSK